MMLATPRGAAGGLSSFADNGKKESVASLSIFISTYSQTAAGSAVEKYDLHH
jgi:hypothetical protein